MKRESTTNVKINSIIGAGAVVEGDFAAQGSTRVDGVINGNVTIQGILVLGAGGKVNGNVEAASAIIGGEVLGDIKVSDKLEVSATAKVLGNIATKILVIDENAVFQGKCDMNQEVPNMKKHGKTAKAVSRAGKKSAKEAIKEALKEAEEEAAAPETAEASATTEI